VRLDPADVEAIAQRVAELLAAAPAPLGPRYVDAAGVAHALGVERDWVYAHARQLGAIRLGGPHGRLRFDLHHVQRSLTERAPSDEPTRAERDRAPHRRSKVGGVELLPYQS
jgi:hypothetical protein